MYAYGYLHIFSCVRLFMYGHESVYIQYVRICDICGRACAYMLMNVCVCVCVYKRVCVVMMDECMDAEREY